LPELGLSIPASLTSRCGEDWLRCRDDGVVSIWTRSVSDRVNGMWCGVMTSGVGIKFDCCPGLGWYMSGPDESDDESVTVDCDRDRLWAVWNMSGCGMCVYGM